MSAPRRDRRVVAALGAFLAAYLALELIFALRLRIDYYDALESLRNARRLLGPDIGFSTNRMPMLALLHAPLQLLLDAFSAGDLARIVAPHVFQLGVSAAFLGLAYAWFRRSLPAPWAALALALLSLDRLTVHYFCFAMTDIPCALFLVLFLLLESGGRPVWAALALGACLCTRSNLLLAPFVYVGVAGLRALSQRPKSFRAAGRAAAVAAGAGAVFVLVNVLVYHRVLAMSLPRAAVFLPATLRSHLAHNQASEPFWNYARMIFAAAGPAACLLFLLGAARLLRKRRLDEGLALALFGALFLAMSAIGHKEARYLYPVVPVLYLVAVGELRELAAAFPRAARAAVAVALISSAAGGLREAFNLGDPAYGNEVLVRLPGLVRSLAGPGARIFWEGDYYWAVPARRGLTRADPGLEVYHVPSPAALAYLLGKPILRPQSTRAAAGDLLIRAPARSERMPQANRIEVLVYGRDGVPEPVALIPPSSS